LKVNKILRTKKKNSNNSNKSKNLTSKPIVPESQKSEVKIKPKKMEMTEKKKTLNDPLKDSDGLKYLSEEDIELDIPELPEAPKKKEKISLKSPGISPEIIDGMKKMKSKEIEVVLVNCGRCGNIIPIPIPKKVVLNSELPVVPISYVHKNKENKDQHCITVHVDHDFDIRRQRISDVILS